MTKGWTREPSQQQKQEARKRSREEIERGFIFKSPFCFSGKK
jgi:hypothetical protein